MLHGTRILTCPTNTPTRFAQAHAQTQEPGAFKPGTARSAPHSRPCQRPVQPGAQVGVAGLQVNACSQASLRLDFKCAGANPCHTSQLATIAGLLERHEGGSLIMVWQWWLAPTSCVHNNLPSRFAENCTLLMNATSAIVNSPPASHLPAGHKQAGQLWYACHAMPLTWGACKPEGNSSHRCHCSRRGLLAVFYRSWPAWHPGARMQHDCQQPPSAREARTEDQL